jgi:hypothetical protein
MGAKKNAIKRIEEARALLVQAANVSVHDFTPEETDRINALERSGVSSAWPNAIASLRATRAANADYALRAAIGILKGE